MSRRRKVVAVERTGGGQRKGFPRWLFKLECGHIVTKSHSTGKGGSLKSVDCYHCVPAQEPVE